MQSFIRDRMGERSVMISRESCRTRNQMGEDLDITGARGVTKERRDGIRDYR